MVAIASVGVFIDNAALDRLTLPGGMVNRYVGRLAVEVVVEAAARAPVRTGAMKASIRLGGGSSNQYGCSERVSIGVGYGIYVTRGTGPLIYSANGKPMPVGKSSGEPSDMWTWRNVVRGQEANNFMAEALHSVMVRHGI